MGAKEDHIAQVQTTLHQPGACLVTHVSAYVDGDKCSHRWGAYKHAQDMKAWYDWPAYRSLEHETRLPPSGRPTKKKWDLDQDTQWNSGPVPNFRLRAGAPYAHNAHHLVPRSVLATAMAKAAEDDPAIVEITRIALLGAQYNLHDKENMIILPMRKLIAAALGLPRHIAGIDAPPGDVAARCDHPVYSSKVLELIKPIFTDFAGMIDDSDHPEEVAEFAREKLVKVSRDLFDRLRTWAKKAKGAALDDAPAAVFR